VRLIVFFFFILSGFAALAQPTGTGEGSFSIQKDDPAIQAIDRILVSGYLNHYCFSTDSTLLNPFGYEKDQLPSFTSEIISQRMKNLDADTPFDLVYNSTVQGFIDLYAVRRKDVTAKVLGLSQLYFPMIEEHLTKYNIPLELKYLAIVESALNPTALSRVGAGGLWQFMPGTGKLYGLNITSYQDERFDPYKSTEAACKYLKFLYDTFDDWQLALAAYNSGPGNVNKAIRRSGGKKDFWSIKPYLPKETQGYVPAFIAVNYIMNHPAEYNLYPKKPLVTCYEVDTVDVKSRVDFAAMSKIIGMSVEDIAYLNGTYKLKQIPDNGYRHYLTLPISKVGLFLANEPLIYAQSAIVIETPPSALANNDGASGETPRKVQEKVIWEETWKTHKVSRGENMASIARKYNVTTKQIKDWNHLRSNSVKSGQKLKIKAKIKKTIQITEQAPIQAADRAMENSSEAADTVKTTTPAPRETRAAPTAPKSTPKYYTVKSGDTLTQIAKKNNTTVAELKKLNPKLTDKLKVGQKITVKK
jgi:membrane-bound lytic murein transglycosylase D